MFQKCFTNVSKNVSCVFLCLFVSILCPSGVFLCLLVSSGVLLVPTQCHHPHHGHHRSRCLGHHHSAPHASVGDVARPATLPGCDVVDDGVGGCIAVDRGGLAVHHCGFVERRQQWMDQKVCLSIVMFDLCYVLTIILTIVMFDHCYV